MLSGAWEKGSWRTHNNLGSRRLAKLLLIFIRRIVFLSVVRTCEETNLCGR